MSAKGGGGTKSVKRFERSNGLDTAIYENYFYPFFCFNRLKCNNFRLSHMIPERRDVYYGLRNANLYPILVTRTYCNKHYLVPCGFVQLAICVC